ncbi:hypothetical protein KM043_012166 [Ampulex compressa]|nr:hypothetical protein KM043_012166 [Ampulex compressa]
MKNIADYFVDTARSREYSSINEDVDMGRTVETENIVGAKRNRVKIKISRKNAEERVCDIIENSNDMIDKTPSPFAKVSNEDVVLLDDTPKNSRLTRLSLRANGSNNSCKAEVSKEGNLHNVLKESNGNLSDDAKDTKSRANIKTVLDERKTEESKVDSKNLVGSYSRDTPGKDESSIDVINILDSDEECNNSGRQEQSNAFQILMNRDKQVQYVSQMKVSPQQADSSVKKLAESKEKLKQYKEKLTALADKKGYTKRKLMELEEEERIERSIENRIKLFKGDTKKEGHTAINATSQKQLSGNLLNYFSKGSSDIIHKDEATISTFVVKADVHVSDTSNLDHLSKSVSNHKVHSKRVIPNILSHSTTIDIPDLERMNTEYRSKQNLSQHNTPRWSLRIKLQSCEDEDLLNGSNNEDELFSPKSKVKFRSEQMKFPKSTLTVSAEEEEVYSKSIRKRDAKGTNESMKLRLRNRDRPKEQTQKQKIMLTSKDANVRASEDNHENSKPKSKIINRIPMKCEKELKILTETEKSNLSLDTDLSNWTDVSTKANEKREKSEESQSDDKVLKRKLNGKLAPLFTKRHKPDPAILAARRLFLQPDIPDIDIKSAEPKTNVCSTLPFPTIGHITQLNGALNSTVSDKNVILSKIQTRYTPFLGKNNYKFLTNCYETPALTKDITKNVVDNIEQVLTEIEERCPDARQIWETISSIVKGQSRKKLSPKARNKKRKSLGKKETAIDTNTKEDGNQDILWTFKYKPTCTQEVIGNEEAAIKLKDWLEGWRSSLIKEEGSSGEEFYSSDCSFSSSNENNHVAVLLGPHGSGKSASVYAVAEELGYSILEVNASSRRTGKKLLKELEEATKSHRIKKEKSNVGLFGKALTNNATKKIPQNSLILLEDIDLIFEEDEGFISATYQLASNTKRPIVMTCRNICPHLCKMAPQQQRIYFQTVVGDRVSALLELISLAETGCRLSDGHLSDLLQKGDLRKALLELQYLSLSGSALQSGTRLEKYNASLWQNMRQYVYRPLIRAGKRRSVKKNLDRETGREERIAALDALANILDNLALRSSLITIEDPALCVIHVEPQASLTLAEDLSPYCSSQSLSTEMAEWIADKTLYKEQSSRCERVQSHGNYMLKKQLNGGVNAALSNVASLVLDRRIIAVDYLPSVRAICRAEERRAAVKGKRGNRFFHYLHGIKVPASVIKPNILSAACKMMQEKVELSDNDTSSNVDNGVDL